MTNLLGFTATIRQRVNARLCGVALGKTVSSWRKVRRVIPEQAAQNSTGTGKDRAAVATTQWRDERREFRSCSNSRR